MASPKPASTDQGDLFAGGGWNELPYPADQPIPITTIDPRSLDDDALLEILPHAGAAECAVYVDEAVRRRPAGAVSALDNLCRRFKGFGLSRPVREQMIAVTGMAAIGGAEAATALRRLLTDNVIAEPGLPLVLDAAAKLRVRVPPGIVHDALNAADPDLRAQACRCARHWPATVPRLIELLEDLHRSVAREAAIALGVMGRNAATTTLIRLLKEEPTSEIMDALVSIGDDECFVALGRVADVWPDLRPMVVTALDSCEHRLAIAIICRIDTKRA